MPPRAAARTHAGRGTRGHRDVFGGRVGRAFVFSIPDWGQSPFAAGQDRARIGAEIDQFNAAARQGCQALGIAFVDITPATRAAAGDHTQFTPDWLHYSGSQMQRWAQLALPVVQAALKTPQNGRALAVIVVRHYSGF